MANVATMALLASRKMVDALESEFLSYQEDDLLLQIVVTIHSIAFI